MGDAYRYLDRPFNIRPFCMWAFFVGVTVLCCMQSLWAAAVWVALLITGLFACQFIKSKDKVIQFLGMSRTFFIGSIALCLAVVLSFGITTIAYTNQKSFAGVGELIGVVESYSVRDGEYCLFTLSTAAFNNEKLGGRVTVSVRDPENAPQLVTGVRVKLSAATLQRANLDERNFNNRIMYKANTYGDRFEVLGFSNELKHVAARQSKDFLSRYMSPVNAELMYSMLFGDKSALETELRDDFAVTGLAHVLAVSGLHVALIIGLLVAVLKLLRIRRKFQFPIVLTVLIFYCYLCDFCFPILRASIMFLVVLGNRIYLRNTDLLSSVCMAAVITLVVFPYAILSASFQLSYACMLGIALFYLPAENFLKKTIIPCAPNWVRSVQTWLVKGTAMYCVTTAATLPLIIKYFGYVPLYGLVANLLFLPLLVFAFQAVVIALVTYFCFPVLYPVNLLTDFLRWGTGTLADAPFAALHVQNGGWWFLFFMAGMLFLTRFVFMRNKYKYATALALFSIYALGFFVYI